MILLVRLREMHTFTMLVRARTVIVADGGAGCVF
ncbi:hypothetical protein Ga0074812_1012 [Parafrankia irregularis]|uniref:Uncharacterized protein n=1 Tax=Parafrankia irregularis TaxID=795642 RepID=A0A0S4QCZ4_9ACTN|nr:hypothetical protein Ga0074812_1012 [Parafrankia irregularis]